MKKIKTHYNTLKVSQDSPAEVMRAAYKVLSQKNHPDKNRNSAESQHMMKIINEAYSVLSDPEKRKKHDSWIQQQELLNINRHQPKRNARNDAEPDQPKRKAPDRDDFQDLRETPLKNNFSWRTAVFAIVSVAGVVTWNLNSKEIQSLEKGKVESSFTKKILIEDEILEFNKELEKVYENIEARKEAAEISVSQYPYTVPKYIALGMNMEQVQSIQGRPSRVHNSFNEVVWRYDTSAVVFVEGLVTDWSDKGSTLKLP